MQGMTGRITGSSVICILSEMPNYDQTLTKNVLTSGPSYVNLCFVG